MKKSIPILGLLAIFFIISCNNTQNKKVNTDDKEVVKDLTIKWNDCLVKQDLKALKVIYAEQVSMYGISISNEQVLLNKENFFGKYPDFNQSIIGDISVTKVTDKQYKTSFIKHLTYNGETTDVAAYLIFERVSDTWKIITESDVITDKNIADLMNGKEKKKLNTCIDVVMEILTTSPRYIEQTDGLYEAVVKNGGTSFGIMVEGSPNPKDDGAMAYSENYEFSVHESYPDYITVTARFTFKPSTRQLYEYDVVQNKLISIEFDKKLLLEFDKIYKLKYSV